MASDVSKANVAIDVALVGRRPRRPAGRRAACVAAAASAAVLSAHPALAINDAWSTSPASNLFSGTNWTTNATVGTATPNGTVSTGDALFFDASSINQLTNDNTGFSYAGFTFNADAVAYNIGGNAITLAGNVTNNGATLETLGLDMAMAATRTFNGGTGGLVLGGSLNGAGGLTLGGTGVVTITGINNSFTGSATLGGGTLVVSSIGASGANSAIGTNGTIVIGSSAGVGKLVYVGAGESTNKIINLSSGFANGGIIDQSGTGVLTFTGNTTSANAVAKTLTLQGSTTGSGLFAGVISNAGGSTLSLAKLGTNMWSLSNTDTYTGATTVGAGVLNVSGGITASSFVTVGTTSGVGAALYQTGNVTNTNASSGGIQIGGAVGAQGYYSLASGTLTVAGEIDPGGSSGGAGTFGQFDMTGGSVVMPNATGSYFLPNRGAAGEATVVNILGGTIAIAAAGTPVNNTINGLTANWGAGTQSALITIGGGASAARFVTPSLPVKLNESGNTTNLAVLNLNANGTLQTLGFGTAVNTNTNGSVNGVLNFNGGTLVAGTAANTTFLGGTGGLAAVNVYGGGGTIDNNGLAIGISNALLGATGTGVASVALGAGGTGYAAAPRVVFSGGTLTNATAGDVATGYATISPTTGAVTGIVITNPGSYTSTTGLVATLTGGGGTGATAGTLTPNAGNTSGAMTFQGAGTTTLSGSSTYAGATIVNAGTLAVTGSLNSSVGGVQVNTGAALAGSATAAATSSIGGLVTVAGGATNASAGAIRLNNGAVNTLSTAGLALGGTSGNFSLLTFDTNSTTSDLIAAGAGGLTVNAGGADIYVSSSGIVAGETVTLITYAAGTGAGFAINSGTTVGGLTLLDPNVAFGVNATLNVTSTAVQLITTGNAAPATAYWIGDQGTTWTAFNGSNGNFTTDKAGTTRTVANPAATTNVIFAATGAQNLTNTLGSDFSINSLTFDATTAADVTSGSNTLTIGAGGISLQSGNGGATLSMTGLALAAPQTWANAATTDLTVTAIVSGTGPLNINNTNTGRTLLSGANTYLGGTTIAGTVLINSATSLGDVSGTAAINAGTLEATATISSARNLSVGSATSTIQVDPTFTYTASGNLTDGGSAGTLNKTGTGTLALTGSTTYSGGTVVSAGTLTATKTLGATGTSLSIASGATTSITGTATVTNVISGAGALTLNSNGGVLALTGVNGTTANATTTTVGGSSITSGIVAGVVDANDGTNLGTGVLTLAGGILEGSANITRPLGTTAGSVQITGGVSGFSAKGGPVTVAIGGAATPTALTWGSTSFNPSVLVLNTNTATAALTFANAIDLGTTGRTIFTTANAATITGAISSDSTGGNLSVYGPGVLGLASSNTYTGGTTIGQYLSGGTQTTTGTALATASGALGTGTIVIGLSGNGVQGLLQLANNVTLANAITLPARNYTTAAALAIENVSGNNTLSGTIGLQSGGSYYYVQSDAGLLTLSGGDAAANGIALNSQTGARQVTLEGLGNGLISGIVADSNGSTGATVALTKAGTGTWTLSGKNTYTGGTTFAANASGTIVLANPAALAAGTAFGFGAFTGNTLDVATDGGDALYSMTSGTGAAFTILSDVATPGPGITHTLGTAAFGGGTVNVGVGPAVTAGSTTAGITFGAVTLSAGSPQVTLFNAASGVTVRIPSVVGVAGGNTHTLGLGGPSTTSAVTGPIADSPTGGGLVAVAMSGTGTWTLASGSTYTGGTTVASGKLLVTATTGSATGTGPVVVTGGTLAGVGTIGNATGPVTLAGGTITVGTVAAADGSLLTTGAEAWNASGGYAVQASSTDGLTAGPLSDKLAMSGLTVGASNTSGSQFTVTVNGSFTVGNGAMILLATDSNTSSPTAVNPFSAAITSQALTLATNGLSPANGTDQLSLATGSDVNGFELYLTDVAAPEPTSLLLAALAAAPLTLGRRRRRAV